MWLSQSTCLTAPTLPPLSVPPRPSSHLLSFLSLCRGPPAIHETLLLLFVTPFLLLPMLFLSPPLHYDLCPSLSHPSPLSVPRAYATPPPFKFYDLSENPSHLFSPSRPATSYQWRMLRVTLYAAFNFITCISIQAAAVSVLLCYYVVVMLLCFCPLVSHDSVCHGNTMGEASKQLNQSLTPRDQNQVKVNLLWEHKVCSQAVFRLTGNHVIKHPATVLVPQRTTD